MPGLGKRDFISLIKLQRILKLLHMSVFEALYNTLKYILIIIRKDNQSYSWYSLYTFLYKHK